MRLKLKTCVLSSVVWLALCFLLILYSFWPQEEKVVRQSMIITMKITRIIRAYHTVCLHFLHSVNC